MSRTRLAVITVALVVAGALAHATGAMYSSGTTGISVTQAAGQTNFTDNMSGGSSAAFFAYSVVIRSRSTSAHTCFYRLVQGTVTGTTADRRIEPGGTFTERWDFSTPGTTDGWKGIVYVCASGQTATLDVDASR